MKYDFSRLKPHLSKLDGVLSDFDGTLADNEVLALDDIRNVYQRHLKQAGILERMKIAEIECCRKFAGTPLPLIRAAVSDRYEYAIPESADDEILRMRKASPAPGQVVNRIEPITQFVEFVAREGLPVGIVTSAERDRTMRFFDRANLGEVFGTDKPVLVSGHSDFTPPKPKPHPDAYEKGLQLIGAAPSRTLTFEDTVHGVSAGVAANIVTVGHLLATHITADPQGRRDLTDAMRAAGAQDVVYNPEKFVSRLEKVLQALPARRSAANFHPVAQPALRLVAGS